MAPRHEIGRIRSVVDAHMRVALTWLRASSLSWARQRLRRPVMFRPGGAGLAGMGALASGAALYLGAPQEPPVWLAPSVAVIAAFLAVWLLVRGERTGTCLVPLAIVFVGTGASLADLRASSLQVRQAPPGETARVVTGWVENISSISRGRVRYTLRVGTLEGVPDPPKRVRVSVAVRQATARLGDPVELRAVLSPPAPPPVPGGYDFSRRAWFSELGGVGFAVSDVAPTRLEVGEGQRERLARRIAAFRGGLSERLTQAGGPRMGAVLAALITGDRSGITEAQTESLRIAGLGHVLAISGLHMALMAGGVFAAASFLLASIEPLARRRDVRKLAALAAMFAASVYLVISGAGVSTQRAFIMTMIVLVAVLFDRRAVTLRGVGVAGLIVLALTPEAAASPGFQMSFAAAAALVASLNAARAGSRRTRAPDPLGMFAGLLARARRFLIGVTATSLVAGLATAPIAAFHFNRIASLGFLANVAAMPVFSGLVMPSAAVAGALAPFGLEDLPATAAAAGLEYVDWVARATAAHEGAWSPAPRGPALALALILWGMIAGCALRSGRGRIAAPLILAGLAVWAWTPRPALWIGEGGAIAYLADGAPAIIARRGDGFGLRVFLEMNGVDPRTRSSDLAKSETCDSSGCVFEIGGRSVAVPAWPGALLEDCARAKIVLVRSSVPPRTAARCPVGALMPAGRALGGGLTVSPGRFGGIHVQRALKPGRPWSRKADASDQS